VLQLLQVAVVAWLPGAVLFRARFGGRARRAAIDPEERLFWAVVLSVAVSLAAVLALAYLGQYTFARLVAADVAVAVVVAAASRFDLRLGAPKRYPSPAALLPAALIALAVWRFFPPAEFVLGGRDPGVYLNEGIQIAQRGTFIYADPVVQSVPASARDLFFPSHQRPDYYGIRFMGFKIIDPDRGIVVGQFPHLFPASIAIGYGVDGLTGARRTVGVWAVLGVIAVYFLGAALFGRAAGFAGALLLTLNLVQVWFARYPSTEVVMQAMLFAALLAIVRAYEDDDEWFSSVAGALLGLMLLLRVDALLAIAGVVAGLCLLVVTGARWRTGFVASLGAVSAVALAYLLGPMFHQSERMIVFLNHLWWWQYGLIVAAAALALVLLAAGRRSEAVRARVRVLAPGGITVALIAAAVYALYLRQPGGRLAAHDADALRTITAYYLTLPGLAAALIGFVLAARRTFWRAPAFFTTLVAHAFFFFYKIRIVPEHFWMSRRYLPLILPAAFLLASVAALGTRRGASLLRPLRWAIGLAFLALLGREYLRATEPIMNHVEFAGVIPRLERIAATIGEQDLLVVESGNAGTDVHALALPLAYIYARNVLVLDSPAPDKTAFGAFLEWAPKRYRHVYFLGAGGTDLLSPAWGAKVVAADRFRVPEFVAGPDEFPRAPRSKQFDYTIYEFTPPGPVDTSGGIVVDLGTNDDLNVLRFHAKEETEGRTFRWSQDDSYVILRAVGANVRSVTLWMSDGGRPDAAPPAIVAVSLDDQAIGSVEVDTGFKPYELEIPPAVAARAAAKNAPVRLKLVTPVWSPEKVLGTVDDRELGVMVDRVAVK
jgi:hypothetical protein